MKYSAHLFYVLLILSLLSFCQTYSFPATTAEKLPNGYEYFVPESGAHMLVSDAGGSVTLGYYLNRVHVGDRFIVGEVIERPPVSRDVDYENEYSFFIFDTTYGKLTQKLTESEFETELKRLDLWRQIRLVERGHRDWL